MDKKKVNIWGWITAVLAVLGVIILLIAAIYSLVNLEKISDECSNFSGEKPYFITAVAIAGVAVGIQIVAIVMAVIGHFINKTNNCKVEGSTGV